MRDLCKEVVVQDSVRVVLCVLVRVEPPEAARGSNGNETAVQSIVAFQLCRAHILWFKSG